MLKRLLRRVRRRIRKRYLVEGTVYRRVREHPKWGLWGLVLSSDKDRGGDVDIMTVHFGWRERRWWDWH